MWSTKKRIQIINWKHKQTEIEENKIATEYAINAKM